MIHEIIKLSTDAILETYIQEPEISFKITKKRPAMIICPGGAYMILASKEGEPVAMDFLSKGFNCFVLKYTVATDRYHPEKGINPKAHYPLPALELMEAIHTVHTHADEWFIDVSNIFLCGFSAGGHVCATVGTRWNDVNLTSKLTFIPEKNELKVSGMILCYPMLGGNPDDYTGEEYLNLLKDKKQMELMNEVCYSEANPDIKSKENFNLINHISSETVPAFIWHSANDPVVDSRQSTAFVEKLQNFGINTEYHIFSRGRHGIGLANSNGAKNADEIDDTIAIWRTLALNWINTLLKGIKL